MNRKLVTTLSLGALALAACSDAPSANTPRTDTGVQTPIETGSHHTPPPTITGVVPSGTSVTVTWNYGENDGGFKIQFDDCTGASCVAGPVEAPLTETSHTKTGLAVGTHRVRVTSHNGGPADQRFRSWSSYSEFAIAGNSKAQVVNFTALPALTYGQGPVTLSATAVDALDNSIATGATITFSKGAGSVGCEVSGNQLTITAATGAGQSCIVVASAAPIGLYLTAAATQAVPIAKASQTISFDLTAISKTFGDAPFTITATGGASGHPVTFASITENRCTISGDEVTIVGAGTCSIKASQAGNDNYEAAADVVSSFEIAKASQTITFDLSSVSKTYGDVPFAISATGGASGNVVTFVSLTPGACTVDGTEVTIEGAGACRIEASQLGNDNYEDAAPVEQAVSIAKALLTIGVVGSGATPYSMSIYFGDAVPTASLEYSGFVYGEGFADIGSPVVKWCKLGSSGCVDLIAPGAVGSYEAHPAPVVTSNYEVTVNRGSLTIQAWTLSGFYQPVDMNNVINTVKAGSTVPLKFEIFKGNEELTLVAAVKSFTATKITCANIAIDDIELTTTGGTILRYDMTGGQFIQNWQTPKTAGVCYRVTMTALDGSNLEALFRLK